LSAELPSSVDRANNYLAFNASGVPIASSGTLNTTDYPVTDLTGNLLDDETVLQAAATLGLIDVINVKNATYGAAGNGTTDDTTEIQAAIAAAAGTSLGIVYFPPGTYLVSSTLNLQSGSTDYDHVTLLGAGRTKSIIKSTVAGNIIFADGASDNLRSGIVIKGLQIQGDGTNTTNGIRIEYATTHSYIEDVYVYNCTNAQIYLDNCWIMPVQNVTVGGGDIGVYGIYLVNADLNIVTNINCSHLGSTGVGIYATSANAFSVRGAHLSYLNKGIEITDGGSSNAGGGVHLEAIWVEATKGTTPKALHLGTHASDTLRGVTITGCHLLSGGDTEPDNISLDRVEYAQILGNSLTAAVGNYNLVTTANSQYIWYGQNYCKTAERLSINSSSTVIHQSTNYIQGRGVGDFAIMSDFGIGTETIPHGGVGAAIVAIEGPNESSSGPHIQFTTDYDDYPLMQILPHRHDNVSIVFDAYWDGTDWKSSSSNSNYQLEKRLNVFNINYGSSVAEGATITWNSGLAVNSSGQVSVGSTTGALVLPSMTTTQRDALTAANGMIIYNTSTNRVEAYENGSWTDI